MERINYLVAARQASVRPRDLLAAIDRGDCTGWLICGQVQVHLEEVESLMFERVDWVPLWVYAREHHHKHITVVRLINAGEIEGVLAGKCRRWVLLPERVATHP